MAIEETIHQKKSSQKKHHLSAYIKCFEDGLENAEIAMLLNVSEITVYRKRREWIARLSDNEPQLELVVESAPNYTPVNFNAEDLSLISFEGKVDYMLAQYSYHEALVKHNNILAEQIRLEYIQAIKADGLEDFIKGKEPSEINFIYRVLYGRN